MLKGYLYIARVDHWFKNVFMLPGVALAVVLANVEPSVGMLIDILVAVLSTCFIASANYVINEWLDAPFDQHHPVKKNRPSVRGQVSGPFVYLEYAMFAATGLGLAYWLNNVFVIFSLSLLAMGALYNIKPFRAKDRAYLDVLSESINNPLRLLLGWSAIVSDMLPPSSILLAYWMGGAFLMAVKRYAEYRFFDDPSQAGMYRLSFRNYTESSLLVSSFYYALASSFFLGIFLIKYRIEFLLSFPLFALLFAWYLSIGMRPMSPTWSPEKFYQEKGFMAYLLVFCAAIAFMFFVDMPWLAQLLEPISYSGLTRS